MSASNNERVAVVAIVGRPNVGKSSLVNRVIGRREAIVEATPGVTRDRRSFVAQWRDRTFEIVDTGGLEPGAEGLEARVAEQAQLAIEAADAAVLVVDAVAGPQQDDLEVAEILRRSDKPVLVVVNKVDDSSVEPEAAAFFRLGLGEPVVVSALHGRGSGDFLDRLLAVLPAGASEVDPDWGSAAIVGRPNVGKSSLVNALLGEERVIVDSVPGTTRDPTDSVIALDTERTMRLVDTAGMRKRLKIDDPLEYFSYIRTRGTFRRVDAVALVIDAAAGVTALDQRLAEDISDAGRACVIVLNKWDLIADDDARRSIERSVETKLRFLGWAPLIRTSALTGRGIKRILPALEEAIDSHRRRLPTSRVNTLIREAQERRPHPRTGGRSFRIRYAVQADSRPPLFLLFANGRLEVEYLRYVENRLREVEPFTGTPIKVETRVKDRH
jgi:GTP-binding protein